MAGSAVVVVSTRDGTARGSEPTVEPSIVASPSMWWTSMGWLASKSNVLVCVCECAELCVSVYGGWVGGATSKRERR